MFKTSSPKGISSPYQTKLNTNLCVTKPIMGRYVTYMRNPNGPGCVFAFGATHYEAIRLCLNRYWKHYKVDAVSGRPLAY